jgi:hypothetical protein
MVFGLANLSKIKVQVTKVATKTTKAIGSPKPDQHKEHFEFGLNNPAFALRTPPKRK